MTEAAVTQAEIEAELRILKDQFSQLRQQQEGLRKHWFRIGLISLAFGTVFAVVVIVFSVLSISRGAPNPSTPFMLALIPLGLLGSALAGTTSLWSAVRKAMRGL
jgi:hypothetical protein